MKLIPLTNMNILDNQSIYWYPIKVAPSGQLISFNISSAESYNHVKAVWCGTRIALHFYLNDYNVCFIYLGHRGDKLISETFGERPLYVKNGSLNYFFSDNEIHNLQVNQDFLEDYFKDQWEVKLEKINAIPDYSTIELAPHPLLHLFNFVRADIFSKPYYKKLFIFLLQNDFLLKWIDPLKIDDNQRNFVLDNSIIISRSDIKNMYDFKKLIKNLAFEAFNRIDYLNALFLAVQCGNDRSIIKYILKNLYSLLPVKEKDIINQGYNYFQPKILIRSIDFHFILTNMSLDQLNSIFFYIKEIFDKVEYYKLRRDKFGTRHRFFCTSKLEYPIDCNDLHNRIKTLGDAVKNILEENEFRRSIEEMWVKEIKFEVITPPQFEDDFQYSISNIWPISRESDKDYLDTENFIKILHYVAHCDYLVYHRGDLLFSFEYSRDLQQMYTILNERLQLNHNFSLFSLLHWKRGGS